MKIKKTFQGSVPENKILNTKSSSQTDTYSCDYVNNELAPIFENISNENGCVTIGKLCIQWGTVSVTPSSQSSTGSYYGSATVSFSKTYKYSPSMMAVAGVGYTSILNVAARNVTTTEGLVFLLAENNTARNCKWLAIGEIA